MPIENLFLNEQLKTKYVDGKLIKYQQNSALILSTMVCANFSRLSTVQPATCGERMTFSALIRYSKASGSLPSANLFSKDDFSYSSTSSPAPKILPDFKAATKSSVTTHFPRAVFKSHNGFWNLPMNSVSIIPIVLSLCGI